MLKLLAQGLHFCDIYTMNFNTRNTRKAAQHNIFFYRKRYTISAEPPAPDGTHTAASLSGNQNTTGEHNARTRRI